MNKTSVTLLAALAMLLAACGSNASETTTSGAGDEATDVPADADGDTPETNAPDGDDTTDDAGAQTDDELAYDGASDDGDEETAGTAAMASTSVLGDTIGRSEALTSARFEGHIELVGGPTSELPGAVTLTFSGAFDQAADASEMSVDLSDLVDAAARAEGDAGASELEAFAGFFAEPLEIITIGDRSWVRWGLLALLTGVEGKWLEGSADDTSDLATSFGFAGPGSPTDLLDSLAEAEADVEVVGSEELRGVSTTHYRALVDAEKLAESLPADERAELEADLGMTPVTELPIELWLDDDGQLHRFVVDLTDPAVLAETGGDVESARFTFDIWDHGAELGIEPPPADQVITEDELGFDVGAFGDLSG